MTASQHGPALNDGRSEAMGCLSEEDLLAFAVGRLETNRLGEVHLHLDACEMCQRLLSAAVHSLAIAATAPAPDETEEVQWNTTFQRGTLVGRRYLIRQFLARGGMGEVYEALDCELQERVALKTVTSTACDNPQAVRRLKGEVQLARRVSHPNVCRIYDFGTHVVARTGAVISFLTMELVAGETLGMRVRLGGALPVPEARALARQLLLGLSAAHEAGVLHRDFKSDNVILRPETDDECSPLILDFGLARALNREASASQSTLVGTFGYIAPEQLDGKPHTMASDVYSFGMVWFEMLTGELPFDANASPAVAALERLHRPAPAPSSKNPSVPRELDAIVLKCLCRSPKDRFKSAADVLAALDSIRPPDAWRSKLGRLTLAAALGIAVCGAALQQWRKPAPAIATVHPALPSPIQQTVLTPAPPNVSSTARDGSAVASRPSSSAQEKRKAAPARDQGGRRRAQGARVGPKEGGSSTANPGNAPATDAEQAAKQAASLSKRGWENPFDPATPANLLVDVSAAAR